MQYVFIFSSRKTMHVICFILFILFILFIYFLQRKFESEMKTNIMRVL